MFLWSLCHKCRKGSVPLVLVTVGTLSFWIGPSAFNLAPSQPFFTQQLGWCPRTHVFHHMHKLISEILNMECKISTTKLVNKVKHDCIVFPQIARMDLSSPFKPSFLHTCSIFPTVIFSKIYLTNTLCSIGFLIILTTFKNHSNSGGPAWLGRLSIWLWLRSWSHGLWVRDPPCALCRQHGAHFGSFVSLSLCPSLACARSLSK